MTQNSGSCFHSPNSKRAWEWQPLLVGDYKCSKITRLCGLEAASGVTGTGECHFRNTSVAQFTNSARTHAGVHNTAQVNIELRMCL